MGWYQLIDYPPAANSPTWGRWNTTATESQSSAPTSRCPEALAITTCVAGAVGRLRSLRDRARAGERGGAISQLGLGPDQGAPGAAGCHGSTRCSAFPYYRQLKADVFQYQLVWNQIAPSQPEHPRNPKDPAYRWSSELGFAVRQARAMGMRVMFEIKGSPSWANGGLRRTGPRSRGPLPPSPPPPRAGSATSTTGRSGGADPQQQLHAPGPQGRRYARILKAAYRALNRVNRRNVVVGGMSFFGGATRPARWIRYLRLPSGKPPPMDWYGHNPFERRFPNIRKKPIGSFRGLERHRHSVEGGEAALARAPQGPAKLWLVARTRSSPTMAPTSSTTTCHGPSRRAAARRLPPRPKAALRKGDGLVPVDRLSAGAERQSWACSPTTECESRPSTPTARCPDACRRLGGVGAQDLRNRLHHQLSLPLLHLG